MIKILYELYEKLFGIHEYINWELGFNYAFNSCCDMHGLSKDGIVNRIIYLLRRKSFYNVWKELPENTKIDWSILHSQSIKIQYEIKKLNEKLDNQMNNLKEALNNRKPKEIKNV